MLSYIAGLLLLISGASNFEGSIDLIYISQYDTTYFTYNIKNDNIRVDKFDSHFILTETILLNLNTEEIFVLSPSRKLFTQINKKNKDISSDKNFLVTKTANSRLINSSVCYQWRVKNIERNTEISYWVTNNNFNFFDKFVRLINNVENIYEFFEKIPESQGYFPILVEERTLLRAEKSTISVNKITPKNFDQAFFNIPVGYNNVNL